MSLDFYVHKNNLVTCPHCYRDHDTETGEEVFWENITHNLGAMAREADLYEALWRPGDKDYARARDIIDPLRLGLGLLVDEPAYFQEFNPANGWGDYDGLVRFTRNVLRACEDNPDGWIYRSV